MGCLAGASDSYVANNYDRDIKFVLLKDSGIKHLIAQRHHRPVDSRQGVKQKGI